MRNARHSLRVLDRLESPDLWTDITEGNRRASVSFEIPKRKSRTSQRVLAGAVALAIVAATTVLVWTAFRPRATVPGGSPPNSTTKETVVVPDVIGLRRDSAVHEIEVISGLTLGSVSRRYDAERPQGVVIDQDPSPGTTVSTSASVSLVVSARNGGVATLLVRDVIALREADAVSLLKAAGFVVRIAHRPDPAVAEGLVSATDPPPGTTVDKGTYVTVIVSTGPP